jgi:hypothetical protein
MNENLESRLYNWKFEQALRYLDGEPQETKDVVEALARMFGNAGWFYGDMQVVVAAAVRSLGVEDDDD